MIEPTYPQKIIDQIEQLAEQLTPPTEIAVTIGINEDDLMLALNHHGSPERKAFMRGKAKTANAIRQNNIELANAGSPDAIRSCLQSLRQMRDELD